MTSWWSDNPLRLLISWARWLALKHPTISLVNRDVPVLGMVVSAIVGLCLPHLNLTRDLGLIQQVNGLLQILAPFFVAALTLIAGFPGDALDRPMGGQPPMMWVAGEEHYPRRRELLGYLFAYLAGLSVLAYLIGGLLVAASNPKPLPLLLTIAHLAGGWGRIAAEAIYGAILTNLFAVTFLGLHFLGNFLSASHLTRSPPSELPPVSPASSQRLGTTPGNRRTPPTTSASNPQNYRLRRP